jgi:hypothetical protein
MNHCDLSCLALHMFLSYVLLHIAYIINLSSCSDGASYLWQMVNTRTGDFMLDVPEGSGSCRGAMPAPPPPPLSPPLPVSLEQLLATENELMQVLTKNLVHR